MASLQAFPSLTEHEFVDACMALEARSADKLDDTDWLSVHWTGKELLIKQRRRSHSSTGADSDNDKEEECQDLMEDLCHNDTLPQNHNQSESLILDFSILLSPTYCVPVLWFSCRRGSGNKSLGLDEVYASLIPATSQASLRNVSVMGGISMAVSQPDL